MRTMAKSSEKIRHVMNAELAGLVLENCDRVSENVPEDDPFDIGGKSINLKKLIIEPFQRCRPTAVAVNAFAVGTDVEPYPEAGSTFGEGATICHQERASAITPSEQAHSQSKGYGQMLGKLLLATKIDSRAKR
jgi:hypothetical protein